MKLIIDIPEEIYTAICDNGYIFDEDSVDISKAIKNGTSVSTEGDLISREALRKAIDNAYGEYDGYDPHDLMRFAERVDTEIDNAPTVEQKNIVVIPTEVIKELAETVVGIIKDIDWKKAFDNYKERPQGKWIDREALSDTTFPFWERYECNKCHKYNDYSNFCPNCGADMRGKKDECI